MNKLVNKYMNAMDGTGERECQATIQCCWIGEDESFERNDRI
jgi:hypothetical protein